MERTCDAEHASLSGKLWSKNNSPGTPSNKSGALDGDEIEYTKVRLIPVAVLIKSVSRLRDRWTAKKNPD